jgi:hypothetical protein
VCSCACPLGHAWRTCCAHCSGRGLRQPCAMWRPRCSAQLLATLHLAAAGHSAAGDAVGAHVARLRWHGNIAFMGFRTVGAIRSRFAVPGTWRAHAGGHSRRRSVPPAVQCAARAGVEASWLAASAAAGGAWRRRGAISTTMSSATSCRGRSVTLCASSTSVQAAFLKAFRSHPRRAGAAPARVTFAHVARRWSGLMHCWRLRRC